MLNKDVRIYAIAEYNYIARIGCPRAEIVKRWENASRGLGKQVFLARFSAGIFI